MLPDPLGGGDVDRAIRLSMAHGDAALAALRPQDAGVDVSDGAKGGSRLKEDDPIGGMLGKVVPDDILAGGVVRAEFRRAVAIE